MTFIYICVYLCRVILSACSPYFHAMFTSELLEARQTEVPIRDIDEHAVDLIVNFCYTSEITIEESNVQTLLPAGKLSDLFLLSLKVINYVCS